MAQSTPPDPNVYAVVVNWNRSNDTIACIESLQTGVSPKIIVVDNGSTDDSVAILRRTFPQVELIASPTNLRFARGYNLGIRRALESGAEAVFIINNDAVIAPDGLAAMLAHTAPDIGVMAPRISYFDQPERLWSMGARIHPWTLEMSGDRRGQLDPGGWPEIIEQDFVTGCAMLLSRRLLETVGFFDEGFTHYYEDMDFCRRVRLAGFRICVIPQARVLHKVALSSGGLDTPDERYWMARSSIRYFNKHGRGGRLLVIAPYRLGSAIKTSLRLLSLRRGDSVRAYWRGLRDGLRDIRKRPDLEIVPTHE